ncbi:hypothetical protein L2725_08055 [Shewanella corallii]|uniref:Uncharacterized protein n=1 Tax=Shewanella corallii TaxID=560080 RepID=A0ABT0N5J7_9GAMM|nr:hypothetical protein [Shewanella corallii]MCL2913743.1 hypothetical protein [Shewanella corallii]
MPKLKKLALALPLTLLIPFFTAAANADASTQSSDDLRTHVVSDATKRKGEQQHLKELAEAKGQKKEDVLAHDEHRRKGEQQHLRELHESRKGAKIKPPKKDE